VELRGKAMNSVGERLKGERMRLGFSVREFAENGGISKTTQSNYENDISRPDAEYLNRISAIGAEIFWIIGCEDGVREKRAAMYSPEENELIEDWRSCNDEVKTVLRLLAKKLKDSERQ
jgi:transcriptional regulator with XRE-family HTH domain